MRFMTRVAWAEAERAWRAERIEEKRRMGWGRWTRYGRGSCEGYGLEIGALLRFNVSANLERREWRVSFNARELGAFTDFDAAIAEAEREARTYMQGMLEHWTIFQSQPKAQRKGGRRR